MSDMGARLGPAQSPDPFRQPRNCVDPQDRGNALDNANQGQSGGTPDINARNRFRRFGVDLTISARPQSGPQPAR
jgi:hypothetical protein